MAYIFCWQLTEFHSPALLFACYPVW